MDAILIRDLRVEALIGIHKRERHLLQTVSIDLEIGLPGADVFESDKVSDTIDYEQVALKIRSLAASWVKVSASKIGVLANARFVGVSIERGKR
jgi:dihydroneopterin aldolase